MRPHLRGGLAVAVLGLAGGALAACTFDPRYPIEPGVAPGAGAQQILPEYPIHEADAPPARAPSPPSRAAAAETEPAYRPAPRSSPVESSDLPPPPSAAAYRSYEDSPVLMLASTRHGRAEPALRGPARDDDAPAADPPRKGRHARDAAAASDDDPAPRSRHGRRKAHGPETVTVGPGENLYRISLRTHVSVEDLARTNGIKAPYALKPGRVLQLPSAGAPEEEAPAQEAVRSRHGEGFREETPRELRAERAEQRRLEREEREQAASASGSSRRRRGTETEPEEARAGPAIRGRAPAPSPPSSSSPSPSSVSPEDLLPPVATTSGRPAAAAPPRSSSSGTSDSLASLPPTGGPRPYNEVFGFHAPSARRGRDRSGRTHEDAAAAVAAAAARHPTIASMSSLPAAADVGAAATLAGRGRFLWPVRGEMLSGFGPQPSGGRNDGVDLAALTGDPVHAAAAGEVVYAGGAIPGFGNLVLIKHAGGYVTAYGHLSRITVAMRQSVGQGEVVGEAGQTGAVLRPEVHFEIRYSPSPDQSAKPVDPTPLLPSRGG